MAHTHRGATKQTAVVDSTMESLDFCEEHEQQRAESISVSVSFAWGIQISEVEKNKKEKCYMLILSVKRHLYYCTYECFVSVIVLLC